MDSADAALLKEIDPSQLGDRLRAARVAKGWTQTQLAGEHISVGYVSRIESGQRRPNAAVLDDMATPPRRPGRPSAPRRHRPRVRRDQADPRLRRALARVRPAPRGRVPGAPGAGPRPRRLAGGARLPGALPDRPRPGEPGLRGRRHPRARAAGLSPTGRAPARQVRDRDESAACASPATSTRRSRSASGSGTSSPAPTSTARDEAVQLAVTLAAAYFVRGDSGHADPDCAARPSSRPRSSTSPTARASAYWNASVFEAEQGSVSNAVPAGRARARPARPRARTPATSPGCAPARHHAARARPARGRRGAAVTSTKAAEELAWSSASPIEIARNDLALARAHYLEGDLQRGRRICARGHRRRRATSAPILAADAAVACRVRSPRRTVTSTARSSAYRQRGLPA